MVANKLRGLRAGSDDVAIKTRRISYILRPMQPDGVRSARPVLQCSIR